MLEHRETRVLPYTADQLFDLVLDIENYPKFLPWVRGMRIKERAENRIVADLVIGYKVYSERFRSNVTYETSKHIHVDYVQGPLQNLKNEWWFRETSEKTCEVEFFVQFSFKSKILQSFATQFFDKALKKMINAFEIEAKKRYGDKA